MSGDVNGLAAESPMIEMKITVVVTGAETLVRADRNATLSEVASAALEQTGNSGQPLEKWEFRDPDGTPILDLSSTLDDLDVDRLFLNLRAGVVAARADEAGEQGGYEGRDRSHDAEWLADWLMEVAEDPTDVPDPMLHDSSSPDGECVDDCPGCLAWEAVRRLVGQDTPEQRALSEGRDCDTCGKPSVCVDRGGFRRCPEHCTNHHSGHENAAAIRAAIKEHLDSHPADPEFLARLHERIEADRAILDHPDMRADAQAGEQR